MRILIGGSPCTHWSIAQTKNRETEPQGLGWELFKNYLIAREKFKPEYFLYENNRSMSQAIREQITRELAVEPIMINSALVSAQNRKRLYWTNIPGVELPEDRGIMLRDILESGIPYKDKSYLLKANPGGGCFENDFVKSRMTHIAEPVSIRYRGREVSTWESRGDGKAGTLDTNGARSGMIAEPVRVANIGKGRQGERVYGVHGKSCTLTSQGGGPGGRTGLYAVPVDSPQIADAEARPGGAETAAYEIVFGEDGQMTMEIGGCKRVIREVRNGQITIRGQQHPIKLADGFYIIRKLTLTESKRLQTVPDEYVFPVSDTQAYKMLGNGWTCDVISHILSHCPGITDEPLTVLSMYDGMSCGRIALNKLGANIEKYYATEIDRYAVKTSQANFPDIIQMGDAFQVREDGWELPA